MSRAASPGPSKKSGAGGNVQRSKSSSGTRDRSGSPERRSKSPKKKKDKDKEPTRAKVGGGASKANDKPLEQWSRSDFLEAISNVCKLNIDKMTGRGTLVVSSTRILDEKVFITLQKPYTFYYPPKALNPTDNPPTTHMYNHLEAFSLLFSLG